ncbi:hypothetical protein S40293_06253 [Stachybotrys chartarum IBT 40293]|nr:hypothetical protein S40293_06253 [Stachybotrys chartarum IBT 40293]
MSPFGISSPANSDSHSHKSPAFGYESEAKRRKTRKGTRSCWECKRRKVRCEFSHSEDAICICCRRRGTECISQEVPEDVVLQSDINRGRHVYLGDRRVLIEDIISDVVNSSRTRGPLAPDSPTRHTTRNPCPHDSQPAIGRGSVQRDAPAPRSGPEQDLNGGLGSLERLSQHLFAATPRRHQLERVCDDAHDLPFYLIQYISEPHSDMSVVTIDRIKERLLSTPTRDAHPVLLARHMLTLAIFLQYLHLDCSLDLGVGFKTSQAIMQELADAAMSFVAIHGNLLASVEGIECMVLEGTFHANMGNLRDAWLTFRRAIGAAQLMGLHRYVGHELLNFLNPRQSAVDTHSLWFRIVYMERFLCLMLGLPSASSDNRFASESALAANTPVSRLERLHAVIASRILDRNADQPSDSDYCVTQEIDAELRRASECLPGRWWLAPNLSGTDGLALFHETQRLMDQVYHYNLLNQLHLPYLLRTGCKAEVERRHACSHDYSKLSCVNASREVLNRFIMLRSFNHAVFCCRAIDFFALLAAMTILLAHLDNHGPGLPCRSAADRLLAHQRDVDRATMEQVLDNMERVGRLGNDALSEKSASLLRRLFDIEAEAAQGRRFDTRMDKILSPATEIAGPSQRLGEDDRVLSIPIPYLGLVNITVPKEEPTTGSLLPGECIHMEEDGHVRHHVASTFPAEAAIASSARTGCVPQHGLNPHQPSPVSLPDLACTEGGRSGPVSVSFVTPMSTPLEDAAVNQNSDMRSVSTADFCDTVFQGVDMAFLNNLTRGGPGLDDAGAWSTNWSS